jgi:spore maturation protein CgeB
MRWVFQTGGAGAAFYAYTSIRRRVEESKPDLVWVDHGAFLGRSLIQSLRATGAPIINYMIDNAWSSIYNVKCRHYRAAIPYYDLTVQVRENALSAAERAGAKHTFLASHSADEIAHRPLDLSEEEKGEYASEVAFIGTWLPERGPFLAELIRRGVPLSIWGDRWSRAPEWKILAARWRGPALGDKSYAAAIQSAKICIGLLSKQVGDVCTSRSVEIPAVGSVLCAERTAEHRELYKEGEEAMFWANAEECATICKTLLSNQTQRAAIARRGHERALRNGHFNENELSKILAELQRVSHAGG